jgi:hypothetical protein
MEMTEEQYLAHYGILRRSGRYPWGSGGPEYNTGPRSFSEYVHQLRREGMSDPDIAQAVGLGSTTKLRATLSIAKNEQRASDIAMAQRLRDKGMAYTAIAERMYGSASKESSVRALLAPGVKDRVDILEATSNMLKDHIKANGPVDIGTGVENWVGVSQTRLKTAVARLEEEGYKVYYKKIPQLGQPGQFTTQTFLAPPGMSYSEAVKKISVLTPYSTDGGRSFLGITKPLPISSKRVEINYSKKNAKGEEIGGGLEDGVIYVRPGVPDCSLGGKRYAQVRIQVDDTHFIKGMAMYKDDLPPGVDLVFNTNKTDTGNKLDALKKLKTTPDGKIDPDNPFGSSVKPSVVEKINGVDHAKTVMNKVYEEGEWENWSKNLSSQFLSKQSPLLAKTQLDLTYEQRKNTYDEIMSLTNPTVRAHLLSKFADETDSAAVHLKAANMPRQSNYAILPMNSLKQNEIYAPAFNNGERVVLVRHPHGGPFEIPELTVNNRHPQSKKLLGDVQDAVAIHSKVAEKLSGADFDGDTVLVIPNNSNRISSKPPLEGLKNFDPKHSYPPYHGMRTIDGGTWNETTKSVDYEPGKLPSGRAKQHAMGDISNLITDMTIKGAPNEELAKAVRHSMVVIDAEKHSLNWRESARVNTIPLLKARYQGKSNAGASTLISRAKSQTRVPERKQGFSIDPVTGEKIHRLTGALDQKGKPKTTKSTKLAETKDAFTLVSDHGGTRMEAIYATHSNNLKALANKARREVAHTPLLETNPSAKKAFAPEVQSLLDKLNVAEKNRPLERHAQALANATVSAKRASNPDMDEIELKKVKAQALAEARIRTGANKKEKRVEITPEEWHAIQSGAVSTSRLKNILDNTDLEKVKEFATPRSKTLMTTAKTSRAQALLRSGYTQKEVADQIGVSLSTLKRSLGGDG